MPKDESEQEKYFLEHGLESVKIWVSGGNSDEPAARCRRVDPRSSRLPHPLVADLEDVPDGRQ